jgi:hypothetical protein
MKSYELNSRTFVDPQSASDVTTEILKLAEETFDGWFDDDEAIDWETFIDRLSNSTLEDGSQLEFSEYYNPAIAKIQRHIRAYKNTRR